MTSLQPLKVTGELRVDPGVSKREKRLRVKGLGHPLEWGVGMQLRENQAVQAEEC